MTVSRVTSSPDTRTGENATSRIAALEQELRFESWTPDRLSTSTVAQIEKRVARGYTAPVMVERVPDASRYGSVGYFPVDSEMRRVPSWTTTSTHIQHPLRMILAAAVAGVISTGVASGSPHVFLVLSASIAAVLTLGVVVGVINARSGVGIDLATVVDDASVGTSRSRLDMFLTLEAHTLADKIMKSRAWNSEYLDIHRAAFSPKREAAEITERAAEIALTRANLPANVSRDSDDLTSNVIAESYAMLDAFTGSLLDRVVAMRAYAEEIEKLSADIVHMDDIQKAMGMLDGIDALAVKLGQDDVSSDRMNRLRRDAEEVRRNIHAQIEFLTGTAPSALEEA